MGLPGVYDTFNEKWCKQTVWIYSDCHFDDIELEEGIAGRPSADEQTKLINSCVGRKDTFICLGDIGNIEYVRKIKGYKILICGNHDQGATQYKRRIETGLFDKNLYSKDDIIKLAKEKYPNWKITINEVTSSFPNYYEVKFDNCLFDEVYEGPLMIGEKLILSHEPLDTPWAFNIHGHIHDLRHKNDKFHFNVCADVINYKPLNLNQFLKSGIFSQICSIHRQTINLATQRKRGKAH